MSKAGDFEIANGDVRVRVTGLSKTLRAMEKAGADAENMRELMYTLGMVVVNAANPPVGPSGDLSTTLRAGRGKTKAVVRAGRAAVPYAGVIHYGWPARNIAPQPFITDALARTRSRLLSMLDAGIGDLLRDNDLK